MEDELKKSDDTKSKLIEAAGEVFAERGFRAATVREISRRAVIPLGAMNYHFRDKQGLYAAVLEHSHQAAIKKYPPELGLRDGSTPAERLRAFIHAFLLRLSDKGVPAWHMKLILQEMSEISDPSGAMDQVMESSVRPLYRHLVRILSELFDEDNPSDAEASNEIFLCAMSVVGQCCHYFTGRRVIGALHPKSFNPADIDRIAGHITRFSLAGIRAAREDFSGDEGQR
ncbi:CerR family C-terminal domain-containing protein [Fundidesulfovibrio butyratiphilus]